MPLLQDLWQSIEILTTGISIVALFETPLGENVLFRLDLSYQEQGAWLLGTRALLLEARSY